MLTGYEQRVNHLNRCLAAFDGTEFSYVSDCCGKLADTLIRDGVVIDAVCPKCEKDCTVHKAPNKTCIELLHSTIQELRAEDTALVSFADKMGFTNRPPDVKNNVLVIGSTNDNSRKVIDCADISEISEDISKLTPREREMTRKRIEKYIMGASDDSDSKKETT